MLATAFTLLATPALAQRPDLSRAVYVAAATADVSSTFYCLQYTGCTERNPAIAWLQPRGAVTMLAVGSAMDLVANMAAERLIGRKHPKLLAVTRYSIAALRVGLAVNNVRHAGLQRDHNRRWGVR
jgi:hypothetical protein